MNFNKALVEQHDGDIDSALKTVRRILTDISPSNTDFLNLEQRLKHHQTVLDKKARKVYSNIFKGAGKQGLFDGLRSDSTAKPEKDTTDDNAADAWIERLRHELSAENGTKG